MDTTGQIFVDKYINRNVNQELALGRFHVVYVTVLFLFSIL